MEEPNMNQQKVNTPNMNQQRVNTPNMNQPNMNYAPNNQNMNYAPNPNMNYAQNPNMNYAQQNSNVDTKPISPWGYLGYEILFAIPLVGFICILIFGLGGSTNVNLKNFARSYMCMWIIALILGAIGVICGLIFGVGVFGILGSSSSSSLYY